MVRLTDHTYIHISYLMVLQSGPVLILVARTYIHAYSMYGHVFKYKYVVCMYVLVHACVRVSVWYSEAMPAHLAEGDAGDMK